MAKTLKYKGCKTVPRLLLLLLEIRPKINSLTRRPNQGTATFTWTTEAEQSFQRLKEHLTKVPILGYPNEHGNFIIDTDASSFGLGTVLSQIQNGQERSYHTTAELSTSQRSTTVLQERSCWL